MVLPNTAPFELHAHIARNEMKVAVSDIVGTVSASDLRGKLDGDALGWIGASFREVYTTGAWSNAIAYCCYYARLATAVVSERRRPKVVPPVNRAREARKSFLPILAVLFGVAMLLGEKVHLKGAEGAALISFVTICAVAVALHQRAVRNEIVRLNQALDIQMAEATLSQFPRRSSDLVVIVKDWHRYSFVSSASQTVLNVSSDTLLRQFGRPC